MTASASDREASPPIHRARTKSFTRRSRALSGSLRRTWEAHSPDYLVAVERDGGQTTVAQRHRPLDLDEVYGRRAPRVLEIGSGNGEQIVTAAHDHPERDFLALEVWRPGVARLVSRAVEAGVGNVRVIEADAAQAIPILFADASFTEVWTFFPDPWRKTRHHKRRLVNASFAARVARVLAEGGLWRLATDWDDYAWQMRDVVEESPFFANPHAGDNPDEGDPRGDHGGFAPRWEGRVLTRFERDGLREGRAVHDLLAVRVSAPEDSAIENSAPKDSGP